MLSYICSKLAVDDSPTEEILSDDDTIFQGMDME